MVVDLCKQLEEIVVAVPDLKRFAYSLARESVGMKPAGRKMADLANGGARERLAAQLDEARQTRTARSGYKPRGPMSDAMRAKMRKITKARWATAKKLGITKGRLPKTTELARAKANAAQPKPAASGQANGGPAAAE